MRVLAKIEYDGTDFCGWQSQPKKRTVQTEIENALAKVYGEKVVICASGRTDGGVHALAQCAHFDLPTTRKISPENLRNAINVKLPQDVKIISLNEVGGDFHARYMAKEKTYQYVCYRSLQPRPLLCRYAHMINKEIDIQKMKESIKVLEGKHDFSSFMTSNGSAKTFVRELFRAEIFEKENFIVFEFSGDGFLYNMVRIIVGTLIEIGIGKRDALDMQRILDAKNRAAAGKTAPSYGLYLKDVKY